MFSLHPGLVCNLTMAEQSLLDCSTEGLLQDAKLIPFKHSITLPVQRQMFPSKLSSICCSDGLGFSCKKLKDPVISTAFSYELCIIYRLDKTVNIVDLDPIPYHQ